MPVLRPSVDCSAKNARREGLDCSAIGVKMAETSEDCRIRSPGGRAIWTTHRSKFWQILTVPSCSTCANQRFIALIFKDSFSEFLSEAGSFREGYTWLQKSGLLQLLSNPGGWPDLSGFGRGGQQHLPVASLAASTMEA
jgi:hypothetical protein